MINTVGCTDRFPSVSPEGERVESLIVSLEPPTELPPQVLAKLQQALGAVVVSPCGRTPEAAPVQMSFYEVQISPGLQYHPTTIGREFIAAGTAMRDGFSLAKYLGSNVPQQQPHRSNTVGPSDQLPN